jgi:hypothetical protein
LLRHVAEEEKSSVQAVLDKVIESYRRERFLHGANSDFAALRADPMAWIEELRERELWKHTLADGLATK